MNKDILNKLKKGRQSLEGNFIMALYSNPSEFFDEYPIDSATDLMTSDGKFYYNLGYNMIKKGIKVFDQVSIETYLNDYPSIQQDYEKRGGYEELAKSSSVVDSDNIEAYYNALIKNNLLIKLCQNGFDMADNYDMLNSLATSDEVFDYYDSLLNALALNASHDLSLESLDYNDRDIKLKQSGEAIGFQFDKYSPMLNKFSNGIPRKGMTMLASYTNGGKTSFVFSNIVLPIVEQGIKVCVISNEQDAIVFKDLLCIYVLTQRLDYWKISRNSLKTLTFTEEDLEYFKKAQEIIRTDYKPYLAFQREFEYGMKNVKRTIKKLARQGFELFIYDTFKVSSSVGDSVWQSFLNDSKELFQITSQIGVGVITPVQVALGTKNHIRWLDESALSNSKQIAEIYEEIYTFRDIWQDEYTGCINDIQAYSFKKDSKGKYMYEKDENGNNVGVKEPITLRQDDGNRYKIFFHTKSRNGEVGQTVVYQFKPYANQWKELGLCTVGSENK